MVFFMSKGIFRGTCGKYIKDEIIKSRDGFVYVPMGDFDNNAFASISWAYAKARESGSSPLVAVLLDDKDVDRGYALIDKVRFFNIGTKKGLERLKEWYERSEDRLPEIFRNANCFAQWDELYRWYVTTSKV